ncbi:MAG: TetR/AcrR family transcriptional regulator [Clostridium sp.]|nr:TetR/AcrR family transcriptional regulator [Clostridium sp.]MCM1443955.1 TetR/AcrR family transcriptional regulator [Candidatus Amulumruptor caecigallinarius]
MPPIKKVQRADIIEASLKILKTEDISSINARRIAKELNCSVQPIFYNFKNMQDLKNEVFKRIYSIYETYMIDGSKQEQAYKGMGIAYINFARNYPNYFKLIFMSETNLTSNNYIDNDNDIIEKGMQFTGFDFEKQKGFHLKVWIFTHGLATLISTNTVKFSEKEVEKLLQESVYEMLMGIKKGKIYE